MEKGVLIPTIDFSDYDASDDRVMTRLANEVEVALTTSGFMKIKNLGITEDQIERAFSLSRAFFTQNEDVKRKSAYTQVRLRILATRA